MQWIGVNIRKLRIEKELSQEYIARKLNIKQPTYAKIEKGDSHSVLKYIETIAKLLDVSMDKLLAQPVFAIQPATDLPKSNSENLSKTVTNTITITIHTNENISNFETYTLDKLVEVRDGLDKFIEDKKKSL